MFLGHFGAGLASKRLSPALSLGTLFMAAQFIDLIWPLFLLAGLERVAIDPGNTAFTPLNFVDYPFTHSFIGVLFWGILFGLVYYLLHKKIRNAVLLGGLVVSHWLLDLIVHRKDLPLLAWSEFKVGFGLWNSIVLTLLLEISIFTGGLIIYLKISRPTGKAGSLGFWGLILFLALSYTANAFGPPPEAVEPIAYVGLLQWLFVAWAYGADRNRTFESHPG